MWHPLTEHICTFEKGSRQGQKQRAIADIYLQATLHGAPLTVFCLRF